MRGHDYEVDPSDDLCRTFRPMKDQTSTPEWISESDNFRHFRARRVNDCVQLTVKIVDAGSEFARIYYLVPEDAQLLSNQLSQAAHPSWCSGEKTYRVTMCPDCMEQVARDPGHIEG